jgi:hypothetical protein
VPVADAGFSVTYTLNKFQPVTVPVQVIYIPGVPIQRGLGAGHAEPLIACTAPYGGLYAEPIMPRLRVAEPRAALTIAAAAMTRPVE